MRATYSPEDNKLRMYPSERLSAEDYNKFKSAGFKWAGRQKLFVAPMWTPSRFDLLVNYCGSVEDEDQTLLERSEERAEAFEGYSENRLKDAHAAKDRAAELTDGIPAGQPILVGHHSQHKAEREAKKIEQAMKKAVNMWETSKYWESRAAGAIADAKYKDSPEVRARRIKKLKAGLRSREKNKAEYVKKLALWSIEDLSLARAQKIAGYFGGFGLPRKEGDRKDWSERCSAYDALCGDDFPENNHPNLYADRSLEEVIDAAQKVYPRSIAWEDRWINHYNNRLSYENAMLAAQGCSHLTEPKPRPKQLPMINCKSTMEIKKLYSRGETETLPLGYMTKAEYKKIYSKGCLISACGTYRQKTAPVHKEGEPHYRSKRHVIFLTDSKEHPLPAKEA